jgi:hypothetical protein
MAKIKSFNNYRKNEEFFHGKAGSGHGEQGLNWLDKAFTWLGDKFGMEVDILSRYLQSKVDGGQIEESESESIAKRLLTRVGGKSREEIQSMVDSEIGMSDMEMETPEF